MHLVGFIIRMKHLPTMYYGEGGTSSVYCSLYEIINT